jgi:uncharacterized protein
VAFTDEIVEKLGFYVYRLIDPRNGETFYVGKGKANRVFAHVAGEHDVDELSEKLLRIREIGLAGFDVAHVIHRHGLDSKTAIEVEAALIDAYPGVTNIAGGYNADERGVMHADEIIEKYQASVAEFQHNLVVINVNRTASELSLYEAVRYAWKIDPKKAKKADYVLAAQRGIIVGAFVATEWLSAVPENFPGTIEPRAGRWGFVGHEAPAQIQKLYLRKRMPDSFRKKGAANPIRYAFKSKNR